MGWSRAEPGQRGGVRHFQKRDQRVGAILDAGRFQECLLLVGGERADHGERAHQRLDRRVVERIPIGVHTPQIEIRFQRRKQALPFDLDGGIGRPEICRERRIVGLDLPERRNGIRLARHAKARDAGQRDLVAPVGASSYAVIRPAQPTSASCGRSAFSSPERGWIMPMTRTPDIAKSIIAR